MFSHVIIIYIFDITTAIYDYNLLLYCKVVVFSLFGSSFTTIKVATTFMEVPTVLHRTTFSSVAPFVLCY